MAECHMNPDFLTDEDVLRLHASLIREFGGDLGVRDHGLLTSAVAQPRATFDGQYLHTGLFMMAGAYLFHLANNHPFVDGNKRAALLASLTFLRINGVTISAGTEILYDLTMAAVQGQADKAAIADELQRLAEDTLAMLEQGDQDVS